jgi:hypothetical protein
MTPIGNRCNAIAEGLAGRAERIDSAAPAVSPFVPRLNESFPLEHRQMDIELIAQVFIAMRVKKTALPRSELAPNQ